MPPVENQSVTSVVLSEEGTAQDRSTHEAGAPPGGAESVRQATDLSKGPEAGWDTLGRRGIWISTARQADKLRAGSTSQPAAEAPRKRAEDKSLLGIVWGEVRKIGFGTIAGSVVFLILIVMLGHECSLALAYRDHFNAGLKALSVGRPDHAQVEFSLSISADPKSSDAYYYRAMSEIENGNNDNALNDYRKALSLDPKNIKVYLAQAALSMKTGKYDAAVEDCSTVIGLNSEYADAYRVRASAYNHLGRYSEALADSTTFLNMYKTMDQHRADALSKRAFTQDQKHDYRGALKDYSDAIACDPHSGSLYAGRAIIYMQMRKWKAGLEDCNAALSLKPDDPALYKVRGICNARLRMGDESLADLDKLVTLHPSVDTHRIRGSQRLAEHDYLGSLADFDYVLGAEPKDRQSHRKYQKAKVALQVLAPKTSAIADAVPHAKMPAPADLKKPFSYLLKKGTTLCLSGDNEPAIEYLTAALKINRNDAGARRYLAYAFSQNNMPKDAVTEFRVLSTLTPLVPVDKWLYANALVACDQSRNAINLYSDLLASAPKNDRVRTCLIKSLLDNGSADEAATLAAEGIAQSPALKSKYSDLLHQAIAAKSPKAKLM